VETPYAGVALRNDLRGEAMGRRYLPLAQNDGDSDGGGVWRDFNDRPGAPQVTTVAKWQIAAHKVRRTALCHAAAV